MLSMEILIKGKLRVKGKMSKPGVATNGEHRVTGKRSKPWAATNGELQKLTSAV